MGFTFNSYYCMPFSRWSHMQVTCYLSNRDVIAAYVQKKFLILSLACLKMWLLCVHLSDSQDTMFNRNTCSQWQLWKVFTPIESLWLLSDTNLGLVTRSWFDSHFAYWSVILYYTIGPKPICHTISITHIHGWMADRWMDGYIMYFLPEPRRLFLGH